MQWHPRITRQPVSYNFQAFRHEISARLRRKGAHLYDIDAYLEKSPDDLSRLTVALSEQNPEMLRVAAHSFKSSSYNPGATTLAELCKALEKVGRDGVLEQAPVLLQERESEYQKAEQILMTSRQTEGAHDGRK